MSYEYHTEDQCDRCDRKVGKDKLIPLNFLYKDLNDVAHKDIGNGYRQYWVCVECKEQRDKISERLRR